MNSLFGLRDNKNFLMRQKIESLSKLLGVVINYLGCGLLKKKFVKKLLNFFVKNGLL
jgi:hypothetical protein